MDREALSRVAAPGAAPLARKRLSRPCALGAEDEWGWARTGPASGALLLASTLHYSTKRIATQGMMATTT